MHSCTTGIVASDCSWKWLAARFQDALEVQSVLFVFSAEFQFEGNDDPTNICVICMNLYLIHLILGH